MKQPLKSEEVRSLLEQADTVLADSELKLSKLSSGQQHVEQLGRDLDRRIAELRASEEVMSISETQKLEDALSDEFDSHAAHDGKIFSHEPMWKYDPDSGMDVCTVCGCEVEVPIEVPIEVPLYHTQEYYNPEPQEEPEYDMMLGTEMVLVEAIQDWVVSVDTSDRVVQMMTDRLIEAALQWAETRGVISFDNEE